jgi:hypothetical protein
MGMKKKLFLVTVVILFFAFSTTASANLIQNGDFENAAADINGAEFTIGTSDTGEWYALGPWAVLAGGPSGSSYYFDHTGGTGGDQRAFQPIDTSSMALTGQEITVSFDYIFELGNWQIQDMGVAVVGLSGPGAKYVAYGGAGYDGTFGIDGVGITRTVLGTMALSSTSGWSNDSLSVVLSQDYDTLLVVFASSAWSGSGGVRGIDNVSVSAVPEPAALLLLGLGLVGLAGVRRKIRK